MAGFLVGPGGGLVGPGGATIGPTAQTDFPPAAVVNVSSAMIDRPPAAEVRVRAADTIYALSDSIAGVATITDPVGVVFAVADVSAFTTEADDPTTMQANTANGALAYTAWVKLVLTRDTYLGFDTYGSGMLDTLLFIFSDDPPVAGSAYVFASDDRTESPYVSNPAEPYLTSARTGPQSAIIGGDNQSTFLVTAGTYYLCVLPFWDNDWLVTPPVSPNPSYIPPETGRALIRITQTPVAQVIGMRQMPHPHSVVSQSPPAAVVNVFTMPFRGKLNSREPFALGTATLNSDEPFDLLGIPAQLTSTEPFWLEGGASLLSVEPFDLGEFASLTSIEPFDLLGAGDIPDVIIPGTGGGSDAPAAIPYGYWIPDDDGYEDLGDVVTD